MKELQKIVVQAQAARREGKAVALATVVGIEGSAYRLPGARMLIVDGAWIAGSISGGCLEDDVVLRAREALATDRPALATYDTTSDDDIVFGVGLGCKGIITLLIEPMRREDDVDFIEFAASCLEERCRGTSATVIRVDGSAAAAVGQRMLMRDGKARSQIGDAALTARIEALMRAQSEPTALARIGLASGEVEIFIEHIDPPAPLVVFGGGHDAMPVVRLAKEIGWHVTLVDHRPAYATSERFPEADRLIVASPQEALARIEPGVDTLALVMTHNYLRDLDLLERLLPSPVRYLGVLGPRRRTDQLLGDLAAKGITPDERQLARLYAPVGLDIGSEGPTEVALSILAEMQAVVTGHDGGHLRERKRPIHQS